MCLIAVCHAIGSKKENANRTPVTVIGFNYIIGKLNFIEISPSLNICYLRLVRCRLLLLCITPYRAVNEISFSEEITPTFLCITHVRGDHLRTC